MNRRSAAHSIGGTLTVLTIDAADGLHNQAPFGTHAELRHPLAQQVRPRARELGPRPPVLKCLARRDCILWQRPEVDRLYALARAVREQLHQVYHPARCGIQQESLSDKYGAYTQGR